mmetsp:Transcript_13425/g.23125  ORF Transcript_13425/g.23125 Transcript_13425/m.23125 type:complete len:258 (+) Transcript_13425:1-774(+)
MRTTSRVASKPSKKSRRVSLAELWVRSESKWCEESNPFGLDMKQVANSKELGKVPCSLSGAVTRTKMCLADLDKHLTEIEQRLLISRTHNAVDNAAVEVSEVSADCSNLSEKKHSGTNSELVNLDIVAAEMAAPQTRASSGSVHPSLSSSARQQFILQKSPRPQSPQLKSPKVHAKKFMNFSPTKCSGRWSLQISPSSGAKQRQVSPNHANASQQTPMRNAHRYAPGAASWHGRLVSHGMMPAGFDALSTNATTMAH